MKNKPLSWLAIVLIVETGLIHFFTAQHAFEDAAYLGYLFIFNFLAALLAGYGIYRRWLWGWALGFVVAGASFGSYVLSRTLGLPVMGVEEWLVPTGLLALVVESLFILLVLFRPWRLIEDETIALALPTLLSQLAPAVTMFLMVVTIGAASYADNRLPHGGEAHILSIEEVAGLSVTSSAELEAQYGVRVAQVAISALDSIVDVRLKVVDPGKAHALLGEHAALYVDDQALILAPHMHSHGDLKPGQIFVIFFPTENTVRSGSQVSLVFDHVVAEAVTAK